MLSDFLLTLSDHERLIVNRLHEIITQSAPELECRFSYKVPYYFGRRRVCFVWPSSSGASGFNNGVILGFCEGNSLEDEGGVLQMGMRKQVGIIPYEHVSEVDASIVIPLLRQALLVDAMFKKR